MLKPLAYTPGSSPRAWGIPQHIWIPSCIYRFIPTCVGNTYRNCHRYAGQTVHPHVRGEYEIVESGHALIFGSSPRAWGIRSVFRLTERNGRFIPTCVGNTSNKSFVDYLVSVHPHVRGEYMSTAEVRLWMCGSSPRAWGIPKRAGIHPLYARFIPTCVGNTESL